MASLALSSLKVDIVIAEVVVTANNSCSLKGVPLLAKAETVGAEAPLGNCGCIFSTFRRNSSHFCGMELADKEGCNSNVIFESPYIDSDFILYTPLIL